MKRTVRASRRISTNEIVIYTDIEGEDSTKIRMSAEDAVRVVNDIVSLLALQPLGEQQLTEARAQLRAHDQHAFEVVAYCVELLDGASNIGFNSGPWEAMSRLQQLSKELGARLAVLEAQNRETKD